MTSNRVFILIALAVMSAILMQSAGWLLLFGISAVMCAVIYVLETEWGFHYEGVKRIKYERVDLACTEHYPDLLADLRTRTGLDLTRVEIGAINYVNDWVNVKVYYDARPARRRHYSEEVDLNGDED